ncbi:glycosyltransferase [Allosphingosinicella flava]|uniref:Glycosyltransferase n=1 Tax=Allosphingosinicella flava TaxID=2771430 RepID=A0A7T2LLW1_9SPHN|nr:glycosyltransferase [Sphingosinicella flava]QPQ54427.1 glycosyltransferase [Sphingosinicella flava]
MANILINGLKSKVGGGKVIFDTYLRLLADSGPEDHYFILTPDRDAYSHYESKKLTVIDVPSWAHSNLATVLLYRVIFPRLLSRHRIDAILNFGDVVIPSNVPQIYNFDWPYAVYPDSEVWDRLRWQERLLFSVKQYFFEKYLSHATVVMAQTDAMKARLEGQYGLSNVVVVPPAVDIPVSDNLNWRFEAPDDAFKLIYPANYYPHKNIEILEEVAELLQASGMRTVIMTTLNEDEHPAAKVFLGRCTAKELDSAILNVGRIPEAAVAAFFRSADALLMPTLLETFGLPYAEAMFHGKPILTSDRDFSRAVCGDAAIYFDPLNAKSIADAVIDLIGNKDLYRVLVKQGRERLSTMWSWRDVFNEYQRTISMIATTTWTTSPVIRNAG